MAGLFVWPRRGSLRTSPAPMPKIITLILSLFFSAHICSAKEPRAVADAAMVAWVDANAEQLKVLAHPELKRRLKTAQIVSFYLEDKPDKKKALENAPDDAWVSILCEGLVAIVPRRDALFEYSDVYQSTEIKNDFAIVTYLSGLRPITSKRPIQYTPQRIILKKHNEEWRFLWSRSVSIHVDLDWEPISETK